MYKFWKSIIELKQNEDTSCYTHLITHDLLEAQHICKSILMTNCPSSKGARRRCEESHNSQDATWHNSFHAFSNYIPKHDSYTPFERVDGCGSRMIRAALTSVVNSKGSTHIAVYPTGAPDASSLTIVFAHVLRYPCLWLCGCTSNSVAAPLRECTRVLENEAPRF